MSLVLPQSVNYKESLPTLPEGTQQINVGASPINGQTFKSGDQIMIDFLNRGFLIPDSIYMSYKIALTLGDAAHTPQMKGCPVYTPFNRLDLQLGSQTVDSINNYNIIMNMLSNLTMSVSEKYGMQTALGYSPDGTLTTVPSLEQLDGRQFTNAIKVANFSGPLMSLLTNSEKLIPLFAMPQVRLILSLDSIANMFIAGAGQIVLPTGYEITNFELRYKIVDMGGNVEEIVRGMGEKIFIKSQSFGSATQLLSPTTGL